MNRTQKQNEIAGLKDRIDGKNFLLTAYLGLTVFEVEELRNKLRAIDCEFKVVKNRLLNIALKELKIEGFEDYLKNSTAIAIHEKGTFQAFKVMSDFAKAHEKFVVKAAQLDGALVDESGVNQIAALPSREVLLSKLVSQIQAPIAKLAYSLQYPINQIVYVLSAIKDKKEKS